MKVLTVKLDYYEGKPLPDKSITGTELTQNYFNYAVTKKYPEGLEGSLRRMYGRIQRKLDAALDTEAKTIDLEDGEADFILTAFQDAKFPADIAKYVNMLEDAIETLRPVIPKP